MTYVSKALRERIQQHFKNRCSYCQSSQQFVPIAFEVEHIQPVAKGGTNVEDNLCLSCRMCNAYKGMQIEARDPATNHLTPLFNPRTQKWDDHFEWSSEGVMIVGKTPVGRSTVDALQLNHYLRLEPRKLWVKVGKHPPQG